MRGVEGKAARLGKCFFNKEAEFCSIENKKKKMGTDWKETEK